MRGRRRLTPGGGARTRQLAPSGPMGATIEPMHPDLPPRVGKLVDTSGHSTETALRDDFIEAKGDSSRAILTVHLTAVIGAGRDAEACPALIPLRVVSHMRAHGSATCALGD